MTTTADSPAETREAPLPSLPAVESGGVTTVADQVISKIASQAAQEVDRVSGRRSRLGLAARSARPVTKIQVDGRWVRVSVEVVVGYPISLRAVTHAVRTRVAERIKTLADLEARQIDVRIVELLVPETDTRRVR